MAAVMFLSTALTAKSALAAWQGGDVALVGVGIVALLAVAAAIHLRVGLLHECAKGESCKLPRSARGASLKLG